MVLGIRSGTENQIGVTNLQRRAYAASNAALSSASQLADPMPSLTAETALIPDTRRRLMRVACRKEPASQPEQSCTMRTCALAIEPGLAGSPAFLYSGRITVAGDSSVRSCTSKRVRRHKFEGCRASHTSYGRGAGMSGKVQTQADTDVRDCLSTHRSFALIAGAGAGKTTSLVEALELVRDREGMKLRRDSQRIACITFTKRAVEVIKARLGFDDLYLVSTLHSFLWEQMKRFNRDIREALRLGRLPALIHKEREKDNGGRSRVATEARAKAMRYEQELAGLDSVETFTYGDVRWGDYSTGQLGHDDVIEIATYLFEHNATFRRLTGLRFPYIFVDEAQDTFAGIMAGLNRVCEGEGLPIVGYFGDPWQQIYDGSAGSFTPPLNGKLITKTENFRCAESVIRLLKGLQADPAWLLVMVTSALSAPDITEYNASELSRTFDLDPYVYISSFISRPES